MSRQSDLDNHANQLNPNNDAYHSSRSGGGRDDDDYGDNAVFTPQYYRQPALRQVWTLEHEFEFTVVAVNGQTSFAKLRVSNTSTWSPKDLYGKIEEAALKAYHQLREGVARVSGSPVTYALLSLDGKPIEELRLWEPTAPAGWSGHWQRVDRKQWKRLARTRSYRRQAVEARSLVNQAAARIVDGLGELAASTKGARLAAVSNAVTAFAVIGKAPLFRVAPLWYAAVESARAMDVIDVVQNVTQGMPVLVRAVRTVDVLARASNSRAPESLRHPAVRGLGPKHSDEYDEYFGHKPCNDRIDQLDLWFTKGERRLRVVLASLKSGKTRARFDLGLFDTYLHNPSLYISPELVERAMKPVRQRTAAKSS